MQGIRTKRLDAGFYSLQASGRTFEAESMERHSEGECLARVWHLFEIRDGDLREWCQTFATLRDCKEAIIEITKEERQ